MIIIPTEKRFDWKHTPIVLFSIVFINILVFFLYQGNDETKLELALDQYRDLNYFEHEWPIYKKYLRSKDELEQLEYFEELIKQSEEIQNLNLPDAYLELMNSSEYSDEFNEQLESMQSGRLFDPTVASSILIDREFYAYLHTNIAQYDIDQKSLRSWSSYRPEIHETIESISYFSLGATAQDFNILTLITSQFLHGDVMHLFGNLFFLLICGFAVEAVVGRLNFLLFYTLSGVAAALLHITFDQQSYSPLIGASGSISGVMAMYLGIFRLKRIEFFYWLFIFVGYIRAPALAILPFYIGKEMYSYFSVPESNVAFMAHVGGFCSGAILIAATQLLKPNMLNETYVDEEQDGITPEQEAMDKYYSFVETFRFDSANKVLDGMIKEQGLTLDLLILKYNLLKLKKNDEYNNCVIRILNEKKMQYSNLPLLERIWVENTAIANKLTNEQKLNLGWRFTGLSNLESAEKIFTYLAKNHNQVQGLSNFAKKMAHSYKSIHRDDKSKQYLKLAAELP
jgi:membrane associated rhomboid family serine protease